MYSFISLDCRKIVVQPLLLRQMGYMLVGLYVNWLFEKRGIYVDFYFQLLMDCKDFGLKLTMESLMTFF